MESHGCHGQRMGGTSRRQQSAKGELWKIRRGVGHRNITIKYYNQVNFISIQPKSFNPPPPPSNKQ